MLVCLVIRNEYCCMFFQSHCPDRTIYFSVVASEAYSCWKKSRGHSLNNVFYALEKSRNFTLMFSCLMRKTGLVRVLAQEAARSNKMFGSPSLS